MKQHKVIVEMNRYEGNGLGGTGYHVATYERVYNSKSGAIRNAREISKSKVFPRVEYDTGGRYLATGYDYYFNIHVEDMDGDKFNYCWSSGICDNYDDLRKPGETTTDAAEEMLAARGFERID